MILFRSYAVHLINLSSIRSNLVIFGLFLHIWSFCPLWFYLVYFGPMQSTLVHFSPITSILSTFVLFGQLWSYSVLIRPLIRSILSTLVLFGSPRPIRSTSVLFALWFYLVLYSPIWSILSTLTLFGPIYHHIGLHQSYFVHSVHFGPIRSSLVLFVWLHFIRSTSVHSDNFSPFGSIWSTSMHSMHSVNFCALR